MQYLHFKDCGIDLEESTFGDAKAVFGDNPTLSEVVESLIECNEQALQTLFSFPSAVV